MQSSNLKMTDVPRSKCPVVCAALIGGEELIDSLFAGTYRSTEEGVFAVEGSVRDVPEMVSRLFTHFSTTHLMHIHCDP